MDDLLRYVNPTGPLPPLLGSRSGPVLIIGSAQCVWDDLERYDHLHIGDRIAVNGAIRYYRKPIQHAASLHPDLMWLWCSWRDDDGFLIHSTHRAAGFPETIWPIHRDGGTSGLFAVLLALMMGYEEIVLAGVPCDSSPHIYDNEPNRLTGEESTKQEWHRSMDAVFKGRVKSLSGRSAEWLGSPL